MTRHVKILVVAISLLPIGSVPERIPPNVLFVVADDLNTRIGPYADQSLALHTPNLDELAAAGVSFTRAYAQYPVCGPSRASFMSGLYPETTGITTNAFATANHRIATPGLADHPSLAGFFREQGYFTARVSKIFHMGVPGGIERGEAGSDDSDSWDFAVNIMGPETLTKGTLEKLSRGDHYGSNFSRMILPEGGEQTQTDVLAADQAIAILENRARTKPSGATNRTKFKPEAPFFLAVGFVRPHVPLIAPERHFDRYPDDDTYLPTFPSDDLDDVPAGAARMANDNRFGMSEEEQRMAVSAYHASVSFMDEQLGRLLDALDRLSLKENTIVVFISDHGFNLGEHSSWQKLSLWEESTRVPLIVSVPDATNGGARVTEIVELIDLYPTLAELAGLGPAAPAILQGQSLANLVAESMDCSARVATSTLPRDAAERENSAASAYTITSGGGASLRTHRWRYNRWGEAGETANEELYDHVNDPGEFTNLIRSHEYASARDSLRAAFDRMRTSARAAGERFGVRSR